MTNTQALILGVVQGLTEYLPVSSSAHLVLVPHFFGWELSGKESFVFDVLVQLGTLVGVLLYFMRPIQEVGISVIKGLIMRKPLHNQAARLGWLVALATVPAGILGLSFKSQLAHYFSSPLAACYFLMVTGLILIAAEWLTQTLDKSYPTRTDAVLIGLAQGFALFPGVSRSGSTIAAGMARGLSRADAARFSFLMSVPVMIGASLVAMLELMGDIQLMSTMWVPLLLGFMSACLTGYLVIRWFMNYLSTRRLYIFASYCLSLGLLGAFYFR